MTQDLSKLSVIELMELGGVELYDSLHFVLTSGEHSSGYANLRPLKKNLPVLRELSYRLTRYALMEGDFSASDRIALIGPETLGAVIAREAVAEYNRRHPDVRPLLAGSFLHDPKDKEKKKFLWGPGGGVALMQPDPAGPVTKVIWVDDLLSKASTWQRSRSLITDFWPSAIKMVATLADRSKETPKSLGVPMVNLRKLIIESSPADTCPLCDQHLPIVRKPGHGHEYEEKHPAYPGGYIDL